MKSTRTSISDTVGRFPNAAARTTESTSISMVSLHSPLIQNGMLKQVTISVLSFHAFTHFK